MSKEKYILKITNNEKEDVTTTNRKVRGNKQRVILTVLLDIVGEFCGYDVPKEDVYEIIDDIYDLVNSQKEEK